MQVRGRFLGGWPAPAVVLVAGAMAAGVPDFRGVGRDCHEHPFVRVDELLPAAR